jgi:NitT/TauT family transport system substrate-binding protein
VALRWFLKSNGFATDTAGGGDVSVLPEDNAQTLTAFKQAKVDGAWVPEPWASRLVLEGNGKVLVDERDLWPQGKFVTTDLVVRTDFLQAHPKRIQALLEGLYQSVAYLNANPGDAQGVTNNALAELTGKQLASGVVSAAWQHMTFTLDPLAPTLKTSADHAHSLGLLPNVNLNGLYDLAPLNAVLAAHNEPPVQGL